jgi:hypothetical protein
MLTARYGEKSRGGRRSALHPSHPWYSEQTWSLPPVISVCVRRLAEAPLRRAARKNSVSQKRPSPARMITRGIREASDMLRRSPEVRCVDE